MEWGNLLFEVFTIVFLAVTSMAMQALFTYLKRKGVLEVVATKAELATIAVQFVEQAYKDFDGAEKFDAAMEHLSFSLGKYGIKVTPAELEALIESAVFEMKQAWFEVTE